MVWALKTLRSYLIYEKFTVYTDHAVLGWLLTINDPSGRLMRWRLRLAEYDFNIEYKTGKTNTQADALSRLHTSAETINDDAEDFPAFHIGESINDFNIQEGIFLSMDNVPDQTPDTDDSLSELNDIEDYTADAVFATLPDPVPSDPMFQQISIEELLVTQQSDAFCMDIRRRLNEGVVMAFGFNDAGLLIRKSEIGPQIVIPHVLKARVLHIHHYARLAGHPGGRKLYQTIRRYMYWPASAVDCYATVRRCPTCARNRIKLRKNVTELQLFPAEAPLELVSIDVLGELIKTARGHEYLLVITDRLTELTKTVPMKGLSAA